MSQDITNSLNSDTRTTTDVEYGDTAFDYTPYASMEPLLVYEHYGTVRAGIMTGINNRGDIKVRKQGVRNGVDGYSAKGTIPARSLVPILCFVEEDLVDKMLLNPAALGMGAVLLRTTEGESDLANRHATLVDTVVEQYEESTPIEDSFFLPGVEKLPCDYIAGTDDDYIAGAAVGDNATNNVDCHQTYSPSLVAHDSACHGACRDSGSLLGYDPEVYGIAS